MRAAVVGELDAVVDLWAREGGPTRTPGRRPAAEALLQRDPDALLVAVVGDTVVGTLIVGWDGWRCHLYRLVVEPGARRLGVARALVDAARHRASALGAARLDAMVATTNTGAVAFWARCGFVLDDADGRWSLLV